MRKIILGLSACAAVTALATGTASAFPVAPIDQLTSPVEQARIVCNQWGRCWRTGPRYYRYGYYGPRRYWGPGYGYYGGPYYGGPGIAFGGPGFGLRFGF
jgi:hypothetical protein